MKTFNQQTRIQAYNERIDELNEAETKLQANQELLTKELDLVQKTKALIIRLVDDLNDDSERNAEYEHDKK